MMKRLKEFEERIEALQKHNPKEIHHDTFMYVTHAVERIRELEIKMEQEHRMTGDYDMVTIRHTIAQCIQVIEGALSDTIEDWETRSYKNKKHFDKVD